VSTAIGKLGVLASHVGLLSTKLPLFSRRLQLPIPLRLDLHLTPGEQVLRRDVADCTVQGDVVVMLDVALDQMPRIFQRQRLLASRDR